MDIIFCTGNVSKLDEAKEFAKKYLRGELEFQKLDFKFKEIQSLSQERILLDKKKQVEDLCKHPFIIDETGMFFDEYNDYPGTFTKYVFRALGYEGLKKLLVNNPSAHYKTTILYASNQEEPKFFTGILKGQISFEKIDHANPEFPFSSIFIPEGYKAPLIDIYHDVNFMDHRKKALIELFSYIDLK